MVLHTGPLRSSQVIGFEIYLYEMNRAGSPICAYCRAAIDIAKHTFLFCFSWAKEKEALFGVFDLGSVNRSYLDITIGYNHWMKTIAVLPLNELHHLILRVRDVKRGVSGEDSPKRGQSPRALSEDSFRF